jgi:replicative DNA helicase
VAEPNPSGDAAQIPTSYAQAAEQVNQAQEKLYANYGDLPPIPWEGVHQLTGPILPGDLWVIGARPANGKSTMMLNIFDHLVRRGFPTLYIGAGSEGPPADVRRQWAALRLGYPTDKVLEGRWGELPSDARDKLFLDLQYQALTHHAVAHFADVGEKLTVEQLVKAMKAFRKVDCARYVLLDHIHRVRFGAKTDDRRGISETTRWLRDMASKYAWGVVVAAQLHRARSEHGPLRDLIPPVVGDLKESGTLEEDGVVILLLHRVKKPDVDAKTVSAVAKNERPIGDIMASQTMAVRIGKHRRRGYNNDKTAFLHIEQDGRLIDQAAMWKSPPAGKGDAYVAEEELPF